MYFKAKRAGKLLVIGSVIKGPSTSITLPLSFSPAHDAPGCVRPTHRIVPGF